MVLLPLRFLDVAKFTTLTPLTLLISSKLSFPSVDLKMSSLPNLAMKSPNLNFHMYLGNLSNTHIPIPHRSCPLHHQFYPLLDNGYSEQ
jgi:hypothetical protein